MVGTLAGLLQFLLLIERKYVWIGAAFAQVPSPTTYLTSCHGGRGVLTLQAVRSGATAVECAGCEPRACAREYSQTNLRVLTNELASTRIRTREYSHTNSRVLAN